MKTGDNKLSFIVIKVIQLNIHGHSQDFFGGGHLSKKFLKISKEIAEMHYFSIWILEKIFENFQKIS